MNQLIIVAMSKGTNHTFGYAHGADEGEEDGLIYGYDWSDGVLSMS